VGGVCSGGRYQGHKKTEKFLPVGAIVTVVGELARNSISTGTGLNLFRCVAMFLTLPSCHAYYMLCLCVCVCVCVQFCSPCTLGCDGARLMPHSALKATG
jgi:hypothetical protein